VPRQERCRMGPLWGHFRRGRLVSTGNFVVGLVGWMSPEERA
jgi:hypothetical protein